MSDQESPVQGISFSLFGGWCPYLTDLKNSKQEKIESERNFEDILQTEKVSVDIYFKSGLVCRILCGIPEELFAHADIEWGQGGLFLIKCQFTSDHNAQNDVSSSLDEIQKRTICQNIIYKIIKEQHHTHLHHDEEDDNLLFLLNVGTTDDISKIKFDVELQSRIIKAIYNQYKLTKPTDYINYVKILLGHAPDADQLEEAIKILYQGVGESTFGIAFLGIHGKEIFMDAQINMELIKMEAVMKSLETLKGRYIFDYMKTHKTSSLKLLPEIVKETAIQLVSPIPAL
jgi:hypothetical protein